MTYAQLKKMMTTKKIEGRSKLTTKQAMIEALNKKENVEVNNVVEVVEVDPNSAINYESRTYDQLKFMLVIKKIKGRSKLTTRDTIIKVLKENEGDVNTEGKYKIWKEETTRLAMLKYREDEEKAKAKEARKEAKEKKEATKEKDVDVKEATKEKEKAKKATKKTKKDKKMSTDEEKKE